MRIKLEISYDGKNYCGFQKQKDKLTVQGVLEDVLSQICCEDISVVASGRTDAGVSAMCQVVHFDAKDAVKVTVGRLNSMLPNDISVLSLSQVDENFHARYSAKKKTYRYFFYVSKVRHSVLDNFALHVEKPLSVERMQTASKEFLGKHDFSAFCSTGSTILDKEREIYLAEVKCVAENLFEFVVTGNGFLYNMVRIMLGTLLDVGLGKINESDIKNILMSKNRKNAGKTVSAKGLVLSSVEY